MKRSGVKTDEGLVARRWRGSPMWNDLGLLGEIPPQGSKHVHVHEQQVVKQNEETRMFDFSFSRPLILPTDRRFSVAGHVCRKQLTRTNMAAVTCCDIYTSSCKIL
jgi:hypothetical protein